MSTDNAHTIPLETAEALFELQGSDESHNGYTVVVSEDLDSGRWTSYHRLIIRRTADDTLWALPYEMGLTEYQDCDRFDGDPVTVDRVRAIEVTTTRYVDA
jgi:hypothetical protein